MNDPKLFQEPELTEAEEDDALMLFVNDNDTSGRWRWKRIRGFFASLHRRNPLEVVWDDTTLYANNTPNTDRDLDFSETFNLDIRQGANRHSFADGYTFFEIAIHSSGVINDFERVTIPPIPSNTLNASSVSQPITLMTFQDSGTSFATVNNIFFGKRSNTSFGIGVRDEAVWTSTDANHCQIVSIVGKKLIVRPSSL